MNTEELRSVCADFCMEGQYIHAYPYGGGHINETYLVDTTATRYILQKVNTSIFTNPVALMGNVAAVTACQHKEITARGGDNRREALTLIPARDGKLYSQREDGFFRLYLFIEGAVCYQTIENSQTFYEAAKAFGNFQKMLADYDATTLAETIPSFHDTTVRFAQLQKAVEEDCAGRVAECRAEIAFLRARQGEMGTIVNALAAGEIPMRVIHNDTKLNNVLMDEKTNCGLCVLDLDTVMPGSLLYDFGDSIRFGASSAAEDETQLNKVEMRLDFYEAYVQGYLEAMGESITENELALLPFSAKLMTMECGMRFLTDYLSGDTYFRIRYSTHNLDRARNQLKLVMDMEQKMTEMQAVTTKYYRKA